MSGHVTSYTRVLTHFHGTMNTQSGHLLSVLKMSDGSRCDGIFAASTDLLRTSFTAALRGWHPLLN